MASRKATPRKRQSASTTHVVTDAEARQLAVQWKLEGTARDAFVAWLPVATAHRRDIEDAAHQLLTPKQLRDQLAAFEAHLEGIKGGWQSCLGVILQEAIDPYVQPQEYDPVGWRKAEQRVKSGALWVDEMLALVRARLRRLDAQIARGPAETGSNRERFQDRLFAEDVVRFHAMWLKEQISRQECAWETMTMAGIAEGSIEGLVKRAAKRARASVPEAAVAPEEQAATVEAWRKAYVGALIDEGFDPESAEECLADLSDQDIDIDADPREAARATAAKWGGG
jgi:hypothetical protein